MEPTTFAELPLSPRVKAAIEAAGYTTPTPIQAQAIPIAVTGQDVLGIAQTGTGKTAGFVLPMITRLETGRARARMPRSLILAPTRELAAQVAQSFEKYGINHKLNVALLIGGVSFDEQEKKLDRGADVLIATPGRMIDHFQRGKLMLMGVEILVIDEADRMLDMGFIPDIEKICKLLPPRRQTLFFSATMPPEIARLVDQFMNSPVRIEAAPPATTAKTITQRFTYCGACEEWEKRESLRNLIRSEPELKNAIIFSNRKRDVAILLKSMLKHGFNAGALHGDMDQTSRTATLDAFRAGKITFLVASDVAARGLDIPDVSHVINFDVPWDGDDYVHRIGRTGRAGKEGRALTLVTIDDLKTLKQIEARIGEATTWSSEPPSEEDIAGAGKRRRGRGRSAGTDRAGGREARGRGERRGERKVSGRGERREREGDRAPVAAAETVRTEVRGEVAQAAPKREAREPRPQREGRERPAREARPQREPREARPPREPREATPPREPHEARPPREPREAKPPREPREDRRPQRPQVSDAELPGFGEQPRRPSEVREARRESRKSEAASEPSRGRSAPARRPAEQPRRSAGEQQVGFDDNVPAFLRRPVRAAT